MKVFLYCPDRHIVYEGSTAKRTGVGGGITVRLRAATALAALGHEVTLACNCQQAHQYSGVQYRPLDDIQSINTDVLIVHSTGGDLSVGGLTAIPVTAQIRILLVDGVTQPRGSDQIHANWVYACSNFIAGVVRTSWNMPDAALFVTHHGVQRSRWNALRRRDPFQLIYTSHPSKGLSTAMEVTRRLRAHDKRFVLHCYGGDQLWGSPAAPSPHVEGVHHHGLVGQDRLLGCYARSGFAIHLQSREEPFGISLAEAMAAGCIVVASPVGAYPELVENNRTGLLINGDHETDTTRDDATRNILRLVADKPEREAMSREAARIPMDWDTVAKTWEAHWNWLLNGRPTLSSQCAICGGGLLRLADGRHCLQCADYTRP